MILDFTEKSLLDKLISSLCNQKRLQAQNAIKNGCRLEMQSKTVAKSLV